MNSGISLALFGLVALAGCRQDGTREIALPITTSHTAAVRPVPAPSVPFARMLAVQAGTGHACALSADGDVWCWGRNDYAQVSYACGELCPSPVRLPLPEPAVDLQLTPHSTCALLRSGAVQCWGGDQQLNRGVQVARLVADAPTACYIDGRSDLICGGWNRFGRLGLPERDADRSEVPTMHPLGRVPLDGAVTSAVVQYHTGCALVSGALSCWGRAFDCKSPGRVDLKEPVSQLNGAGSTICLVTTSGAAYVHPGYPGSKTPLCEDTRDLFLEELGEPVARGVKQIACAGRSRTCVIDVDDRVACTSDERPGTLSLVPGLPKIGQVALGASFACALSQPGQVLCWGDNRFGQLGRGTARLEVLHEPAELNWPDRSTEPRSNGSSAASPR